MVWTDPEIKKLSREFVAVADEVEKVYPEQLRDQERRKDDPAFVFIRNYGLQVPKKDWAETGTKQGIYMIGPGGEYLEGLWAAASNAPEIQRRLERALDRWNTIRRQKGYANEPVPIEPWTPPPGVAGQLVLRVNSRDLPRGNGDKSGARFYEAQRNDADWSDFFKWAWNENWIALPVVRDLVPSGTREETVGRRAVVPIATKALIDNVRGKAPDWRSDDAREMYLTMKQISASKGRRRIEYTGRIWMAAGSRGYDASVYGQGVWIEAEGRFESFDLVALGMRYGAADHNQRNSDLGPAPMGVTVSLRRQ